MMSLVFADPKSGKTLAALAAFPNAAVATTKKEAVLDPATLYGIEVLEDRFAVVKSMKELKVFAKLHKDKPLIIDDLSDLLQMELKRCEDEGFLDHEAYGELNKRVIPWLRSVSKKAVEPVIMTAWSRAAKIQKDITGEKGLVKATPAFPGAVLRATLPGLCEHVLYVEAQDPAKSPWPFHFRTRPTPLVSASCRAPASVPNTLPLALSAIYRAAGYECEPMFPTQKKVREPAYKALTNPDRAKGRKAMAAMFDKLEKEGVNMYAAGYAVVEAQVQLALEKHNAGLAKALAGGFF